ncbi:MAG TPA: hypothetical protein PLH27_13765 [bacterium]|nr:hypothetical protein [bacterium]
MDNHLIALLESDQPKAPEPIIPQKITTKLIQNSKQVTQEIANIFVQKEITEENFQYIEKNIGILAQNELFKIAFLLSDIGPENINKKCRGADYSNAENKYELIKSIILVHLQIKQDERNDLSYKNTLLTSTPT